MVGHIDFIHLISGERFLDLFNNGAAVVTSNEDIDLHMGYH